MKKEFPPDKAAATGYIFAMSFAEVLQELPALTFEQRQLLIRRALELDDPPLSEAEEALVELIVMLARPSGPSTCTMP